MHFWEVQMEAWVKTAESRHGSLIKANRHMRLTLEKADKVSCATLQLYPTRLCTTPSVAVSFLSSLRKPNDCASSVNMLAYKI